MTMTLRWHSCSKEEYPHRPHKVTQACHNCRTKKMRCDGKLPCSRCTLTKLKCGYSNKKSTKNTPKPTHGDNSNKIISSSRQLVSDDDGDYVTTATTVSKRHPNQQHSQQQKLSNIFDSQQLKHLSFKHNFYDSMRNSSPISIFGKSQLPPLLFGFFSLTCQPYSVWTTFIQLFRQYNNSTRYQQAYTTASPSSAVSAELSQEIMSLFGSHNYLYSAFMDMTQVISFLNASPHNVFDHQNQSSPPPANGTESHWVIINSIFALVFQAASQSLSHHYPDLSPLLQKQSSLFYQRAHQLFITITYPCFGQTSTTLESLELLDLTRASILLTHYQCVTIGEEQAYMTLQMGLGYAHRLGLYELASTTASSCPSGGSNNIKQLDCFKVLQKVLCGWQLWFSIYLNRSQPTSMMLSQDTSSELECKSEVRMENYLGKKGNQRWTVDVLSVYIQFFKRITNATGDNYLTLLDIQHHLKQMETWSSTFYNTRLNFTGINATDNSSQHNAIPSLSKVRASQNLPAYVLSLYHQTLTIQLLQSQDPLLVQLLTSSSSSLSSLYNTLVMPSPAPSSPRRDSGIGSHDGQLTLESTPDRNNNHSLLGSPSSQTYSMDAQTTLADNQTLLSQVKKEGNESVNGFDEVISLDALTYAASVIMNTVDEIMMDGAPIDPSPAPVPGCEKMESAHAIVVYPLYVVTTLLSALAFSARQSLNILAPYSDDDETQRRQRYLLLCHGLDQHLSQLSGLLFSTSSRVPITQYLLQFTNDMMVALDTPSLGHQYGNATLIQKEQEKIAANETKSLGGISGLAADLPYPILHSSLPIRSTLSPTPSSSSSSSTSVSTGPSMSTFSSSAPQPPSTSTSSSSTSSLNAIHTTAINKLLETTSKPGIMQERQMAKPTPQDPQTRHIIDQQQIAKLPLIKGMSSPFAPSYTTTYAEISSKRALDSTTTPHQLNMDQKSTRLTKKFKLTTTPEPGTMGDTSSKIPGNQQPRYTETQRQYQDQMQDQQHQHMYNDPFSSNVMTTRYLDQLNDLSDQSQLHHMYSTDCLTDGNLTDDNLWMAFVGNSSLNAPTLSTPTMNEMVPRSKRKLPMEGLHDVNSNNNNNILTPKLPLPQIKHKNPTIPKTWQATMAPINVDWNVCFSAEMNRTLHQGLQQQPISVDVATAAAAAAGASLEQVDPSIQMNMQASTPTHQDNVLYLLSSNIHPSVQHPQHQQNHHHHHQQQQQQQQQQNHSHEQRQHHQEHHHQPDSTNYFPTSSAWNGVDSSFF